jgi:hypothetical protein
MIVADPDIFLGTSFCFRIAANAKEATALIRFLVNPYYSRPRNTSNTGFARVFPRDSAPYPPGRVPISGDFQWIFPGVPVDWETTAVP